MICNKKSEISTRHSLSLSLSLYPGLNGETMKGSYEATIAYGRRALKHRAAQASDRAVELRALVEIDACEIQLPKITRIIHVIKQRIHIVAQAEA